MTWNGAPRQYGPWVGLLVAAAAYFPRFAEGPVGMALYPQAADCVLQGAPLRQCAELFSYPPAFAFLMIPFALMPMSVRVVVWYVISVAATVGYQLADAAPRPDLLLAGLTIEYSIPYFESKVRPLALPWPETIR